MAINLIVAAVTLLMAAFVIAWAVNPAWRAWMEEPKFRFARRAREFPRVARDPSTADRSDRREIPD